MNLRVHGDNVPTCLFELIGAMTDHAILDLTSVDFNETFREVRFSVTRFPLLKQRKVLGNLHDRENPIPSTVYVRNVSSCSIQDIRADELGGTVELMFGVTIRDQSVHVSSAEEDRGTTCFVMDLAIDSLDVQLTDEECDERDPT
jgi:hypothetical protein